MPDGGFARRATIISQRRTPARFPQPFKAREPLLHDVTEVIKRIEQSPVLAQLVMALAFLAGAALHLFIQI